MPIRMNSGGDGYDDSDDAFENDNVVPLKVPRQKKTAPSKKPPADNEPLINLPPVTKYFLGVIIAIHLIVAFLLAPEIKNWLFINLGFIPARFTGTIPFEPLALLTPLSHMLLHGSWLHIAMNAIMLLAFGSGIEKWIGGRTMIIIFLVSGLVGVLTHFGLNHNSVYPMIGASGGLSGLFAAALIMINQQQGGARKIWPFILLWIGISVLFGFMGSPDGGQVAWAAHVGGFLGGFAAMKLLKKI